MPNNQPNNQPGNQSLSLHRNDLTVECRFNASGKLERKTERHGGKQTDYTYTFDEKGHLTDVTRDGKPTERYRYNTSGQRVEQDREYRGFSDATGGILRYGENGLLASAGDTAFHYDARGALAERRDSRGTTIFHYGQDTMLDTVRLPNGLEIRYEYHPSNPTGPARRFRNGKLAAEFAWIDPARLAGYRDHDQMLEYVFAYDETGALDRIQIMPFRPEGPARRPASWADDSADWLQSMSARNKNGRLEAFLEGYGMPLLLYCGCDQVGTLKILTDKYGRLVKEVLRDSFGVQYGDSFPDLFMPVGFAGGLTDPDTGLVRFGYRDYDPSVGRFTAPDPARDMRGDGDIYDYCVDDPVNRMDPAGLFFMDGLTPPQGIKEWESHVMKEPQAEKVKNPEVGGANPKTIGHRKGILEIETMDEFGTLEFDQKVQQAEIKAYGKSGDRRRGLRYQYGDVDDKKLAAMDGGSLPPTMSLEELRKQPYYTKELEMYHTRDWTPVRAEMTAKALIEGDDHLTPSGLRKINLELEKMDAFGTLEFDQKVQQAEIKAYGKSGDRRRGLRYQYGDVDDKKLAAMDGGSLPPVMSLGELRKQPYYTEELEYFYTRDWTPLRAEMTAKALARDNELRRLKAESPVTLTEMGVDYMKNYPIYLLQDMKDERKLIVGTAAGVGGAAAVGATGLTGMMFSGAVNAVTTKGLKVMGESSKKAQHPSRNRYKNKQ